VTDASDARIVREIAQKVADIALHDAVHVDQWISAVINSELGDECKLTRVRYHTAVAHRLAVVKPSWPAEQAAGDGKAMEGQERVAPLRLLKQAFSAGWHSHSAAMNGALATIGWEDREEAATHWVKIVGADLAARDEPVGCLECGHLAASHYTGTGIKAGCALCGCVRSSALAAGDGREAGA